MGCFFSSSFFYFHLNFQITHKLLELREALTMDKKSWTVKKYYFIVSLLSFSIILILGIITLCFSYIFAFYLRHFLYDVHFLPRDLFILAVRSIIFSVLFIPPSLLVIFYSLFVFLPGKIRRTLEVNHEIELGTVDSLTEILIKKMLKKKSFQDVILKDNKLIVMDSNLINAKKNLIKSSCCNVEIPESSKFCPKCGMEL